MWKVTKRRKRRVGNEGLTNIDELIRMIIKGFDTVKGYAKGVRIYVNIYEGFLQKLKGLHEGKSDLRRVLNITEYF